MKQKAQYSIGEVSKLCNISRKALRYYDDIQLINSSRQGCNNYRYYTKDALLAIPVIKYYKQMGFTLEEMRSFIDGIESRNIYKSIRNSFSSKLQELEKNQEDIRKQHASIKDWHDLISEAESVIDNNFCDVSVKYLERESYLYQEQTFSNDMKSAVINIEWTNYVESIDNKVTGPIILNFSSTEQRMQNQPQPMRIMQKTLLPAPEAAHMPFGGCIMASCYHIGPHETMPETYAKMHRWAQSAGYSLAEESFERCVTDYWSTMNANLYVTELLIRASRR